MKKLRRIQKPGINAPPGSAMIFPEPDSVRGVVVIEAAMHEFYTILKAPIHITVDGQIQSVSGGGSDLPIWERSLLRAGNGQYGRIIHLSYGFHPAARFTGQSFNEDIRVKGMAAVGFGIPWWEPGGGENHPDGVVPAQSLWIDGRQIIRDGNIIEPQNLAKAARELQPIIN
jgi:leucyl aminopeptidase (aminopeptidase T)